MSRKIKYELKCNFNYSQVTIELQADDEKLITPDDLARILEGALDDYCELDLGAELH